MHDRTESSVELQQVRRSHVLVVLGNAQVNQEAQFRSWYQGAYHQAVLKMPGVLNAQHYERDEVDITRGRWPPPPFQYLGIYALALDGAEASAALIESIARLHEEEPAAQTPATWLYYPVSEKVGRSPSKTPSPLVLAFANALPGRETDFREWYATRHIRHALSISTLASGQCFERTGFQHPGVLPAKFHIIAMYEQIGAAQAFLAAAAAIPKGSLPFPMLDLSCFGESIYQPLPQNCGLHMEGLG